ncbi:unnamed protein product [Cylicostephanus goldi]|uniref:MIR domain-containing protein n=1 Tax=Cylicostephanus goldi TaxID=71465 RepID=A0A3P6RA06_CYLGO|nr:unnamed protein product [Cylicostephanus goldi]
MTKSCANSALQKNLQIRIGVKDSSLTQLPWKGFGNLPVIRGLKSSTIKVVVTLRSMSWIAILIVSLCLTLAFADDEVTCGTVLKLMNINEAARLHSHEVKYGSGSGQQSVTAVTASDDVNSHWQIFPGRGLKETCKRGEPMKCGEKLRLKHLTTGCFLHTHHFTAPLSKHYQVFDFSLCFRVPLLLFNLTYR